MSKAEEKADVKENKRYYKVSHALVKIPTLHNCYSHSTRYHKQHISMGLFPGSFLGYRSVENFLEDYSR